MNDVAYALYLSTGDTAEDEPPLRLGTAIGDALGLWTLMAVTFILVWFQLSQLGDWEKIVAFGVALLAAGLMQWFASRHPLKAKIVAVPWAASVSFSWAAIFALISYVLPPEFLFEVFLIRLGCFPALAVIGSAEIIHRRLTALTTLLSILGGAAAAAALLESLTTTGFMIPFLTELGTRSPIGAGFVESFEFDSDPWVALLFGAPFLWFSTRGHVIDFFDVRRSTRLKLAKALTWCAALALLHSYYRISFSFFLAVVSGSSGDSSSHHYDE